MSMVPVNKVEYDPRQFSLEKFKEVFGALFSKREVSRSFVIYTGLGGMYTFDYALAMETGLISTHMTKKHARFMRLMGMGLYKAVDENGIVWMIGKVKGKGYYFTNMHQKAPVQRTANTRFISWEYHLGKGWDTAKTGITFANMEWAKEMLDRHKDKKRAKVTGERIKGTRYDDKEWQAYHHGY